MFLYQKLNYKYQHEEKLTQIVKDFELVKPVIMTFDTETTGLNFMKDTPFLSSVAFGKYVYTFEPTKENIKIIYELGKRVKYFFTHNAKYDWHMMINNGTDVPDDVPISDSMVVARLTQYADELDSISLEALGIAYVDDEAKFAAKVIKKKLNEINKARLKELKTYLKTIKLPDNTTEVMKEYRSRVQFVEHKWDELFADMNKHYTEPNYYDVYLEEPELMLSYAADDAVILLEYLGKAFPLLTGKADPTLRVFNQENKLIRVVGDLERNGLPADIEYLLSSRLLMLAYKDKLYKHLEELTGQKFTSGQHKVIMDLFRLQYNITLSTCDVDALTAITKWYPDKEEAEVARTIVELRTVDKWLSTYIEGMLNRIQDGQIHTSINNSGTITGRVSCNMQQQPKEPFLDRDGNELFHPRRVFKNKPDGETYYFDFSQMELRLQAHYTLLISGGDLNLCRAFMPFKCISGITGDVFNYPVDNWESKEWFDEDDKMWTPTDLHTVTTLKAFPDLTLDHPKFEHYRMLGKRCNFLKNYGGGVDAIIESLGVDADIAKALDNGYYEAFPLVRDYQKWVETTLTKQGYVENIFGRKYYLRSSGNYYKAYDYLIQGGCADIMKEKEINIYNFLKANNLKSTMLLPVHDEIQVNVVFGEEWIVSEIKHIMDDNNLLIPMICDVEVTHSNWAEKEKY